MLEKLSECILAIMLSEYISLDRGMFAALAGLVGGVGSGGAGAAGGTERMSRTLTGSEQERKALERARRLEVWLRAVLVDYRLNGQHSVEQIFLDLRIGAGGCKEAHEQLANFTIRWLNMTANGTLAYDRSGFFGWMLPLAYAELRSDGAAPPWNTSFTTLFKRACHSFMAPQIVSEDGTQGDVPGCDPSAAHAGTYGCGGGDGYWEIGNWNKGFNHWADSVAMLHAFGDEWDVAPGVNGMYKTYNARMHDSWVAQHPYEENSCNYNGISYFCAATIGYMLNETRTILPASVRDVFLVRKTPSLSRFILKTINSPRQARDKHRKS